MGGGKGEHGKDGRAKERGLKAAPTDYQGFGAERRCMRSHAERGNEKA